MKENRIKKTEQLDLLLDFTMGVERNQVIISY